MREANSHGINFISGAQTLYFSNRSFQFESGVRKTIKTLNREKISLAWRQHSSYEYGEKYYSRGAQNVEVPDMAFMLGPRFHLRTPRYDVVVMFRDDKESLAPTSPEMVCEEVVKRNYTCSVVGWGREGGEDSPLNFSSPRDLWDSAVQHGLAAVATGRVMVTDRLHGTILSYLAGIGVVYIENLSRKTTGVLNTAFGCGMNLTGTDNEDGYCDCLYSDPTFVQSHNNLDDILDRTKEILEYIDS